MYRTEEETSCLIVCSDLSFHIDLHLSISKAYAQPLQIFFLPDRHMIDLSTRLFLNLWVELLVRKVEFDAVLRLPIFLGIERVYPVLLLKTEISYMRPTSFSIYRTLLVQQKPFLMNLYRFNRQNWNMFKLKGNFLHLFDFFLIV